MFHTISAEVLGQEEFSAEVFEIEITGIQVPEFNRLVFVFHNGCAAEKVWQDRPRRESWTVEMRQGDREKAKGAVK